MIDPREREFIKTAKEFEDLKAQLERVRMEMEAQAEALGVGRMFQDPEDGTVYKITVPAGTFVSFRRFGYDRTAKTGERQGSLSKKEAQEKGFKLPEKK